MELALRDTRLMPWWALLLSFLPVANCCSCFYMNYTSPDYAISVRTEDMADRLADVIHSFPRGRVANPPNSTSWIGKFGFVGFVNSDDPMLPVDPLSNIYDGMNEVGLSCGSLTLPDTVYSTPGQDVGKNLFAPYFCRWVLEQFSTIGEVRNALQGMHVFETPGLNFVQHFVIQDSSKGALVVEWLKGEMKVYTDLNDGVSGYGILTNAPPFEWQVRNVQLMEWKQRTSGGGGEGEFPGPVAVAMPGTYYPDERFLRIHILRTSIEQHAQPESYQEAVTSATSILNSVQVPIGNPPGVDARDDHTKWAVLRDHKNVLYYVRTRLNPSLHRIDLSKLSAAFQAGGPVLKLGAILDFQSIPWFNDVTNELMGGIDQDDVGPHIALI